MYLGDLSSASTCAEYGECLKGYAGPGKLCALQARHELTVWLMRATRKSKRRAYIIFTSASLARLACCGLCSIRVTSAPILIERFTSNSERPLT